MIDKALGQRWSTLSIKIPSYHTKLLKREIQEDHIVQGNGRYISLNMAIESMVACYVDDVLMPRFGMGTAVPMEIKVGEL